MSRDHPWLKEAVPEDKRNELSEYERGYLDGLWAYAWWKSGTAYVGTTGTTHKRAVERFLEERGKVGWTARYGEGK